jgi:hypothetical protein
MKTKNWNNTTQDKCGYTLQDIKEIVENDGLDNWGLAEQVYILKQYIAVMRSLVAWR